MRARRKRILWAVVAGILLCLGAPLVLISQQLRQKSLDGALVQAVKKLDTPAVARLLAEGANANAIDTGEPPPTVPRLLKRLLARLRHQPDGTADGELKSVLAWHLTRDELYRPASESRVDIIAATLVAHGANINLRDEYELFSLHIAVRFGLHQTVRAMLTRGVDVNARDSRGFTPISGTDDQNMRQLVEHGADVNAISGGWTPLMRAVFYSDLDAAQILIPHGADVNAPVLGHSILLWAEAKGKTNPNNAAILRLLKQHGARLNEKDQAVLAREQPAAPLSKAGETRRAKKR
jgi:ankyrin repeat protein